MSLEQRKEEYKNQFPPYLFVLKEGPEVVKNLFDYSLCMMKIQPASFKQSDSKIVVASKNKYDSRIG